MSLLVWTGNPFVDSGIAAIIVQQKKNKPEDIVKENLENVSEFIQSIYVTEKWKKAIYSIFVNYPLSQPSYKTEEKKREKLKEFLDDLLSEAEEIKERGDCIACGRRSTSKRKNRQYIPMTGSGGVTNYFSFTADGADYCDICAFAVQCSPLTYYACGKLGLLHSNSPKILRRWANITLENIQQQKILKNYTGCFNEGFTNPQNALFHLLEDLTRNLEENWSEENPSLRLYHFTNYGPRPDLDIYDLPTSVFRFFAEIRNNPKYQDWRNIVRRGYFFVKKGKEIGLNTKEKTADNYKNNKNRIYRKLLAGRSILPHFLNIRSRKAYGDFSLLEVYLKEVLNMNKTRIETIKKVADEIANFIRASDKGKARLRNLEESTKFRDFCNVLRRISMERIALLKPEKPLFTLDEVAEELFPEGALTFGETRYLILFRLYEQLHDWLLAQGLTPEEADDGIQDSGNDGILNLESNTAQILEGENYQ